MTFLYASASIFVHKTWGSKHAFLKLAQGSCGQVDYLPFIQIASLVSKEEVPISGDSAKPILEKGVCGGLGAELTSRN